MRLTQTTVTTRAITQKSTRYSALRTTLRSCALRLKNAEFTLSTTAYFRTRARTAFTLTARDATATAALTATKTRLTTAGTSSTNGRTTTTAGGAFTPCPRLSRPRRRSTNTLTAKTELSANICALATRAGGLTLPTSFPMNLWRTSENPSRRKIPRRLSSVRFGRMRAIRKATEQEGNFCSVNSLTRL